MDYEELVKKLEIPLKKSAKYMKRKWNWDGEEQELIQEAILRIIQRKAKFDKDKSKKSAENYYMLIAFQGMQEFLRANYFCVKIPGHKFAEKGGIDFTKYFNRDLNETDKIKDDTEDEMIDKIFRYQGLSDEEKAIVMFIESGYKIKEISTYYKKDKKELLEILEKIKVKKS
jgi:DNA-directed RNA polymerase specialized sigma24 family protein